MNTTTAPQPLSPGHVIASVRTATHRRGYGTIVVTVQASNGPRGPRLDVVTHRHGGRPSLVTATTADRLEADCAAALAR